MFNLKQSFAFFFLLSSVVHASEWAMKSDQSINDLMLIAQKGNYLSETSYFSQSYNDQALILNNGKNLFTRKHDHSEIEQALSYGILDNLNVGIKIGYQLSDKIILAYGPGSTSNGTTETYEDNGLKSPTITSKYRLLNQGSQFANLDMGLNLSPKLGTKKDAVDGKSGNAVNDNTNFTLFAEVGKTYTDMGWKVSISNIFYGTGKSQDVDDSTSITSKNSYNELSLEGSWQWVFATKYALTLSGGFGSIGEQTASSTSISSTEEKRSTTTFKLNFEYLLDSNKSIALGFNSREVDKYNFTITQSNSKTIIPVSKTSDDTFNVSYKMFF